MTITRVPVNPQIMIWARKTLRLSIPSAAKKLSISETTLEAWEAGTLKPTPKQFYRMAAKYQRPPALFLAKELPKGMNIAKLPEFRSLDPHALNYTADLAGTIQKVQYKQKVAEMLQKGERPLLNELGPFSMKWDPGNLASYLRDEVGFSFERQSKFSTPYEALNGWIQFVEDLGIFVVQAGVSINEMRGFSLASPIAPFICLNTKDAPNARIFTLAHELGHLLLGEHGICDLEPISHLEGRSRTIENYCNEFAANLLMPKVEVEKQLERDSWIDLTRLAELASTFSVSRYAMLIRLKNLQHLDEDRVNQMLPQIITPPSKKEKPQGSYYANKLSEHGVYYASIVVEAFHQDQLSSSELASCLSLKYDHFAKFEKKLIEKQQKRLSV